MKNAPAAGAADALTYLVDDKDNKDRVQPSADETLSEPAATRLTQRIRLLAQSTCDQLRKLKTLVDEAQAGKAHIVLGYPSWPAYLADVLGDLHLHLGRDDRRDLVGYLSDKGMSTRAIATTVNVARNTVKSDLQVGQIDPPATERAPAADTEVFVTNTGQEIVVTGAERSMSNVVTGLDGKAYRSSRSHGRIVDDSVRLRYVSALKHLQRSLQRVAKLRRNPRVAIERVPLRSAYWEAWGDLEGEVAELCFDLWFDAPFKDELIPDLQSDARRRQGLKLVEDGDGSVGVSS